MKKALNKLTAPKSVAPERIIQFGEGNFRILCIYAYATITLQSYSVSFVCTSIKCRNM